MAVPGGQGPDEPTVAHPTVQGGLGMEFRAPSEPHADPSRPQGLSTPAPDDTAQIPRVGDGVTETGERNLVSVDSSPRVPESPETSARPSNAASPRGGTGLAHSATGVPHKAASRSRMAPDWTHMPLRMVAAAAIVALCLSAAVASLQSVAEWINP
ncbi:hypothetical protein [Salininema proteolyticum]|uniref:Uncharacterized protein n=1 Tax=Salininema proteolyticum TaxID=1607685 RepID=A0ABV8TT07_9ACTN